MKYVVCYAVLWSFAQKVSFTRTAWLNLHTFEMFENYVRKTDAPIFFLYYPLTPFLRAPAPNVFLA